jgi:hypothetical protein
MFVRKLVMRLLVVYTSGEPGPRFGANFKPAAGSAALRNTFEMYPVLERHKQASNAGLTFYPPLVSGDTARTAGAKFAQGMHERTAAPLQRVVADVKLEAP